MSVTIKDDELRERMERKMEEFSKEKKKTKKRTSKPKMKMTLDSKEIADDDQTSGASWHGNSSRNQVPEAPCQGSSLHSHLTKQMADDLFFVASATSKNIPSLEERMSHKIAEFDKPANQQPEKESLEARMQRKMAAEYGDTGPTLAGPGPASGSHISRKGERMEDTRRSQSAKESLEARMQRKMATEYGSSGPTLAGPGPASSSQRSRKDARMEDENRSQPGTESLEARMQRKMAAEYGDTGPTLAGPAPHGRRVRRSENREDRAAHKMAEDDQHSQANNGFEPPRPRASGILLEMSMVDETPARSMRLSGPVVSVSRPTSISQASLPPIASESAARPTDGPDSSVSMPLRPPMGSLSKQRGETLSAGEKPGAYQVAGRAIGAQPAWGRRLRQMGENIRGSMRNIASHNGEGGERRVNESHSQRYLFQSQRHLPPEMRTPGVPHVPPETRFVAPSFGAAMGDEPGSNSYDNAVDAIFAEDPKPSSRTYLCIFAAILLVVGVGVGAGVTLSGGKKAPHSTAYPTLAPIPVTTAPSVVCPYLEANFPEVIIDCACGTKLVSKFEDNVSNAYFTLRPAFMIEGNTDDCTSSNIALWWLANDTLYNDFNDNEKRETNRFILASLFVDWTKEMPDRWNRTDGWLSADDECTWYGIMCTDEKITGLNFTDNNPKPETGLPASLFLLKDLVSLDLTKSYFEKAIPKEIANLRSLERLALAFHQFTGVLPLELFTMTKLQHLDLSVGGEFFDSQGLIGPLPQDIGALTGLTHFALSHTNMKGQLPIELYRLSNLVHLNLEFNKFIGRINLEVGGLTSLEILSLAQNEISGTLPTTLGNLTNLMYLHLSNELTGSIPSELSALSKLRSLDLAGISDLRDNNIMARGFGLFGSIPESLGSLTSLSKYRFVQCFVFGALCSLTHIAQRT
jgi:Leucine rich repeat